MERIVKRILLVLVMVVVLSYTEEARATETEGYYEYEVSNGEAIITKYNGDETDVVVPETLGGYPVVAIKRLHNKEMVTLTFGEGLRDIEYYALGSSKNLKTIYLPASFGAEELENFLYNTVVSTVVLSDDNPYIKVHEGAIYSADMKKLICYLPANTQEVFKIPDGVETIGSHAFYSHDYIKEIIMPDTVVSIGRFAFACCDLVEKIDISDNCKSIEDYAFSFAGKMKELYIPASVEEMEAPLVFGRPLEHFGRTFALQNITVDKDNKVFFSLDGVLYSYVDDTYKNLRNKLVYYPEGRIDKIFEVPDGVSIIGEASLRDDELEEIVLPNSIKIIKGVAIEYDEVKINFPDSIEMIESENMDTDLYGEALPDFFVLPKSVKVLDTYLVCRAKILIVQENVTELPWDVEWKTPHELFFMGDVPTRLENWLKWMKDDDICYYPAGNETWLRFIEQSNLDVNWKEWDCKRELRENADGTWSYYIGPYVNTFFTGLVKGEAGWCYVKNGESDSLYTGLVEGDNGWFYVKNGESDSAYTGVAQNKYGWWYMKNGELDMSYNGLLKTEYGWWYMKNGRLNTAYTGLVKYKSSWVYINKGKLDTSYTGLVKYKSSWVYVNKGKLDATFTGMAKNKYGWWYVKRGKLDLTYTGISKNKYGCWYMKKGGIDFGYTGLAENKHGTWYIQKGYLNMKYTGTVTIDGTTYNIKNGKVN